MKRFIVGGVVAAFIVVTGYPVHAGSPADAVSASAITGWPTRGSLLRMTCPGIHACYAVGSLPVPSPLPARPYPSHGGVIASTHDGGQSWTYHTDPHTLFGEIACPNPTQCYVMTVHIHIRTRDQHHAIVTAIGGISVTGNGGRTWKEHRLPSQDGSKDAIACPAVTICVVWTAAANPASQQATVFITTDGGRRWTTTRIVTQGRPTGARLACPTIQICYLYGGFDGTAISKSQDGGRTWRALPGTDMFALSGVPAHALASMGGLACPSARVCYTAQGDPRCQCDAWGPYGTIVDTRDGGKQWRLLYRASGRDFPQGTIACPSASTCFVVGLRQRDVPADQIILATRDEGRTWTTHTLPAVPFLACPGITTCYAASHAAAVFRTTDGAVTWHRLP